MIDWTRGMAQTFEFREVDPATWQDARPLGCISSAEIEFDSESDTGGRATFESSEDLGERYVRAYLVLPPMYFPPFTPMIHNRSRQPAPAGYANVFPPLSAPPSNLSRNARASRARALSEPG